MVKELRAGNGFQRRLFLDRCLIYSVIVQNKPASFSPSILFLESQVKAEDSAGCCPQVQVGEAFPTPLQTAAEPTGSPAVPNEESSGFKVPLGWGNQTAFWKQEHLLSKLGFWYFEYESLYEFESWKYLWLSRVGTQLSLWRGLGHIFLCENYI